MIGHRKLMKAAFFKRSELFRTRTKLAKEQTEVFRVQQPHTANESRLEKAFNALEREVSPVPRGSTTLIALLATTLTHRMVVVMVI